MSKPVDGVAFAHLMAALGTDPDRQAEVYENLRTRLAAFFRYRGVADPGLLVDRTLDRVGVKLARERIDLSEPSRYVLGVARFVLLEHGREQARRAKAEASVTPRASPAEVVQQETLHAALEGCLASLLPAQRRLVERYHAGQGRDRIEARRRLREELGISENALKIRVHRIRASLERCIRARLERDTESGERS